MTAKGLLHDRVVVVTGAGRGLGRAFALACAEEGASVAIADIEMGPARETAEEVSSRGGAAISIRADVATYSQVTTMTEQVLSEFGRIDVLINNAAVFDVPRRSFEQIPEDEWDRVMAVNVRGPWNCCRAIVPHMRKLGRGKIINVCSDTVLSGVPGFLHYVSSKGALLAFTRAICREIGSDGICVNALAPGFTETPTALEHGGEAARRRTVEGRAIPRAEVPADLVGTILYLASDQSDFVTGQLLTVNGGYVLH
jgi:3-oxoacyl-[acyl-carrier protein] reductase